MQRAITFVHSPLVDYGQNYGTRFAPLWAYTLAAYVPATFEKRVVDCTQEDVGSVGYADVFAFSGINQDLPCILEALGKLKARHPRALFILGGPITWSFQQEGRLGLLAAFDFLFVLDGEETLPRFLNALEQGALQQLPRVISAERFELARARKLDFDVYRAGAPASYYGASIEVSRGCPFLCEFCDIRSIAGNNRANNKSVPLIIEEMSAYAALGVSQFLFVCDNFIGDPRWAKECADAIVAWRARTGFKPSIFTWLTLNLAKQPELMKQLRRAGFSVLYIGVESANQDSLLETAKLQNRVDLRAALAKIHGHGFVVAPGLIFGFDSDTRHVFDETLQLGLDAGLIGGDPSFLTALPGTPLFERMQRTGRLVTGSPEQSTRRLKISTNVRYLQDPAWLARGFQRFMAELTSSGYQLARFEKHLQLVLESDDFVPHGGAGFGSPWQYLRLQLGSAESRKMLTARLSYLLASPKNSLAVLRAFVKWRKAERARPGLGVHFYFWLYFWTNLALKYRGLSATDFELHGVPADFDVEAVALDAAQALISVQQLLEPRSKASKQASHTSAALARLVRAPRSAALQDAE